MTASKRPLLPTRWEAARAMVDGMPRVPVACLPTPLEEHPRLAKVLGLEGLYVKREDLTGLAFGGNKVRELDFILAAALESGADTLVAGGGGAQSNHARQCAAAARKVGLEPVIVLRETADHRRSTGNLLVTDLLVDGVRWIDIDRGLSDREAAGDEMDRIANQLRDEGRRPWILRSSFHPLAAVGYVDGGLELVEQLGALGVTDAQVVCSSMGATRVGIELAFAACGLDWPVHAMAWRPMVSDLPDRLRGLARETAALLGMDAWVQADAPFSTYDHGGPAYGVPSPAGLAAAQLAARSEGLLLDPVYTAKALAGLISELQAGTIDPTRPVVFVHTGGLPVLFADASDRSGT
jgi:1-aminocyclopropane-1-carboxylate deaminase/D-cysteine desulfhydrase-like pyridoxal-dependent ACC family enzyme